MVTSSSTFASRSLVAQTGQLRDRCSCCCNHAQRILPPSRREGENRPPAALPEPLAASALDAAPASASWLATTTAAAAAAATPSTGPATATLGAAYVPSPYTPGPEIWLGALLPTLVFALGSYEFGKRILIQRRCAVCAGTGLVDVPFVTSSSSSSSSSSSGPRQQQQQFRKVKCRACGGFFPWESASKFFSAAARPGNGGPLRPPALPRQTSVFYRVPSAEEARRVAEELRAGREKGGGGGGEGDAE
jgi:hypothetical protein